MVPVGPFQLGTSCGSAIVPPLASDLGLVTAPWVPLGRGSKPEQNIPSAAVRAASSESSVVLGTDLEGCACPFSSPSKVFPAACNGEAIPFPVRWRSHPIPSAMEKPRPGKATLRMLQGWQRVLGWGGKAWGQPWHPPPAQPSLLAGLRKAGKGEVCWIPRCGREARQPRWMCSRARCVVGAFAEHMVCQNHPVPRDPGKFAA